MLNLQQFKRNFKKKLRKSLIRSLLELDETKYCIYINPVAVKNAKIVFVEPLIQRYGRVVKFLVALVCNLKLS